MDALLCMPSKLYLFESFCCMICTVISLPVGKILHIQQSVAALLPAHCYIVGFVARPNYSEFNDKITAVWKRVFALLEYLCLFKMSELSKPNVHLWSHRRCHPKIQRSALYFKTVANLHLCTLFINLKVKMCMVPLKGISQRWKIIIKQHIHGKRINSNKTVHYHPSTHSSGIFELAPY